MDTVSAVGRGYTHSETFFGKITALQTASLREILQGKLPEVATHVFIWFTLQDGSTVYYEALIGKGWTGPHPIEKVIGWQKAHPKRRLRLYELTECLHITAPDMRSRLYWAEKKKTKWEYSPWQLLLQFRWQRVARRFLGHSFAKPSADKVICSEAAALLLDNPPFFDTRRKCGVTDFDLINPAMLERVDAKCGKLLTIIQGIDMGKRWLAKPEEALWNTRVQRALEWRKHYSIEQNWPVIDEYYRHQFADSTNTMPRFNLIYMMGQTLIPNLVFQAPGIINTPTRSDTTYMASIWDSIDIAVVPSTEPEPFGLVALEAMLAKKPVIAAKHGGLTEIIDENKTGFINLITGKM